MELVDVLEKLSNSPSQDWEMPWLLHICCLPFHIRTLPVWQVQILQISEAGLAIGVLKLKAHREAKLFQVCFELDVFSNTSAVIIVPALFVLLLFRAWPFKAV